MRVLLRCNYHQIELLIFEKCFQRTCPVFTNKIVCYTLHLIIIPMQELIMQGRQQKYNCPAFDVRRTLGMSNQTILYRLQDIWLLLLMGLNIWTTILPKIGVPYLWWIWLLYLISINSACRLPLIIMGHLCILVIILPLSNVAKTFYCNDSNITDFELIDTKNSPAVYVEMYKLIT